MFLQNQTRVNSNTLIVKFALLVHGNAYSILTF